VINEQRGSKSLQGFVSTVWEDLRYAKSLTGVDMQFSKIDRLEGLVMDDLVKGLSLSLILLSVAKATSRPTKMPCEVITVQC